MARQYRVDGGRSKSGAELLAFAQTRHRMNNKGVHRPTNIRKAIWFLGLRGAYGKHGKGYRVESKLSTEKTWF